MKAKMLLYLAAALALLPAVARAGDGPHWTEETLELAATLPIQDQGRIKPLYTFARYNLMAISGGSSYRNEAGRKVTAVEWLLDCLFRPDVARKERAILIQSDEVLTGIGVRVEGRRKRDRYSFDEVMGGVEKLFSLAEELDGIPARKREPAQEQTILLARNMDVLGALLTAGVRPGAHEDHTSNVLVIFPPADGRPEWRTPREVLAGAARAPEAWKRQADLAAVLFELPGVAGDRVKFGERFRVLHDGIRTLAEEQGAFEKIRLEVFLFRGAFFHWSLGLFALGFVFVALTWLLPNLRPLRFAPPAFLVAATAALTIG
ncbi:MAG: hypothetical protein MUE73_15400, partial [Planctomycetes bacterium]|nr:hypothetical protein [Planctomycetota bacterium]